jgi:hypothetical protein
MSADLNYFNYFTEIEDVFVRLRAKHVFISPLDWVLIEQWKSKGIPLYVVIRSIETAFASHASSRNRRAIKTLVYCQEEVEAQYAEWLDSQVGATITDAVETETPDAKPAKAYALPFPREVILEHLAAGETAMRALAADPAAADPALAEAMQRVIARYDEIRDGFQKSAAPSAEALEDNLTALEQVLHPALLAHLPSEEIAAARAAADLQLKPYKAKMEKDVYAQTRDGLVLKQILAQRNLPRFSLFYI